MDSRHPKVSPLAAGLLWLAALLMALGVVLAEGPSSAGEKEPPATTEQVETVDVRLAMLEVVVVDRKGRHVRGLPASAFHLKEGRREVPIITFDEIDLDERMTPQPAADRQTSPTPPAAEPSTTPESPTATPEPPTAEPHTAPRQPVSAGQTARIRQQGKRWFVLLFDGYFNPSALSISQARRAAKKWLKENLRDGDQVAVYQLLPHLTTVQSFTSRRDLLEEALDGIRVMPGSSMGQDMIRQRLEQTQAMPQEFRERQLRNAGNFGSQLDRSERDNFYLSMANLGQALGPLVGSKAVLLFSGGFPITRSWDTNSTGGLTERFKYMMEVLEFYGVRVFSFDVGEENTFTGAEQATNIRQMVDNLGLGTEWLDSLQVGAQIDSSASHQEVLAILGTETGGRFTRGKDYLKGLNRVSEDLSHYYLIGYRPIDLIRAGRYVRLRADVDGKGLKVIARRGRFSSASAEPEVDDSAATAAKLAGPPLAIRCQPQVFPLPGDKSLLVLPIRVGNLDPLTRDSELPERAEFHLRTRALIADVTIEESQRDISVPISEALLQRLNAGFALREAMVLSAATYDVEVTIQAPAFRRSGRWKGRVAVRSTNLRDFSLTDLSILSPADGSTPVFDVFLQHQPVKGNNPPGPLPDPLGDARGRPPISAGGSYDAATPLLVQVGVVKPPPQIDPKVNPLEMVWEVICGDADPVEIPISYRRLDFAPGGAYLDVIAQLDLSGIKPGSCTLQLTATRIATNTTITRQAPLLIQAGPGTH